MDRNFSEDNRLGAAIDTPASENSLARERGPVGQQLTEGVRPEDKLAKAQTAEGAQVLPTLGQPRVPDEGEALWEEFVRANTERGRLNLNATQNQRQNLVIIAKLKRYHGPGWSYFLASKKMKRQRNAPSDYHPIVMRALGISRDPNGRARPLTVTLDEWERSGKEPDQIPEWLESEGGPDGVYRKYLARQRRRLTKNERDMAVHDLSELRPICKFALPHPLAYLDGDYQAVVHIDAVQQTLEIKAVDPKVTPAWLRANAERLVSSRAMLDMRPTPKEPDIAVDTFMTKPNGGEIRNTAGDSAAAARRFINARDRSGVPFDDDRDRIVRGHPAAEAIFRLKRPVTEPTVSDTLVRADQSQRRRRVLETLSTAPVRHEAAVETPVSSEPPITPAIQAVTIQACSSLGRLRHDGSPDSPNVWSCCRRDQENSAEAPAVIRRGGALLPRRIELWTGPLESSPRLKAGQLVLASSARDGAQLPILQASSEFNADRRAVVRFIADKVAGRYELAPLRRSPAHPMNGVSPG